jgi:4-diphosphocytidyl-2-C-methyl-D-erythritol kinase
MFRAYAKINIGLRVLQKRPDGYHDIETLFHRIDLFDEIELSQSDEIVVVSSSSEVPAGESNICHKAARLLQEHLQRRVGVHIAISKNIPVGAGLGGGSSDAATVLRALPRFWNVFIDERTLQTIALQLGSDVPYFLGRGSAVGRGRGEVLEHFALEIPYTILVCNPNIPISTGWAYANVVPDSSPTQDLKHLVTEGMRNPALLVDALRNDFEGPVFTHYPEIRQIKETMMRNGAVFASLSGSGSSVFGFFSDAGDVETTARTLRSKGWRTFLTPPHFSI